MQKPVITIEYGDWLQEYREKERDMTSEANILTAIEERCSTALAARLCIVAREQQHAPEDILPSNKLLLMAGGREAVSALVTSQLVEFETEDGKKYSARAYVADLPGDDEEEDEREHAFVEAQSIRGLENAERYLLNRVPGYIFGRLKIIALNGGDVQGAADTLKATIDEMVERLE